MLASYPSLQVAIMLLFLLYMHKVNPRPLMPTQFNIIAIEHMHFPFRRQN